MCVWDIQRSFLVPLGLGEIFEFNLILFSSGIGFQIYCLFNSLLIPSSFVGGLARSVYLTTYVMTSFFTLFWVFFCQCVLVRLRYCGLVSGDYGLTPDKRDPFADLALSW